MATILELNQVGALVALDPCLSWREQAERRIFLTTAVRDQIANVLPNEVSNWSIEIAPIEQLVEFARVFCSGEELCFERQFKPIRHISHGVWELKTADVRLFGWFPIKDHFICGAIDTAARIKNHGLYASYRDQIVRIRQSLDLDEPKFLPGDNPNVVVSNFSYPPS